MEVSLAIWGIIMEVRDPELKKIIHGMNEELLTKIEGNRMSVIKMFNDIREQHKEDVHVTLNGEEERTVHIKTAIAQIYDDTTVLRDWKKASYLVKKYKWLIITGGGGTGIATLLRFWLM